MCDYVQNQNGRPSRYMKTGRKTRKGRETKRTRGNTPQRRGKGYIREEESTVLCRLTQRNDSEDPEERCIPSKVCSKNPENSTRERNVLNLIDFHILNVVSQIGQGTGFNRSLFWSF